MYLILVVVLIQCISLNCIKRDNCKSENIWPLLHFVSHNKLTLEVLFMCDAISSLLEMLLSPAQCGHYLRTCWGIIAGLFLLFSFWVNLAGLPGLLRVFDPRGQQKQEDLKPWFQVTVTCYSMLTINTLPVSFFFIGITWDLLKSYFYWFSFLGWRAFCPRIANAFKSKW